MPQAARDRTVESVAFFAVLAAVSIVFTWSILPFVGALLWALVAAILFAPLVERIRVRVGGRRGLAAGITVFVIALAVVLPAIVLGVMLVDQAGALYGQLQSEHVDLAALFERVLAFLPDWAHGLLGRMGITDFSSFSDKVSAEIGGQLRSLLGRAVNIGQGAASFLLSLAIMLYVTFFFLRDGRALATRIGEVVPLAPDERALLADRFVTVVAATVKGGVLVGLAQGTVGGIVMAVLGVPNALLWAVVMGFASLLPAVGTGLVWVPASLYLFATGDVWQGVVMALAGMLVIGSIDNVLRPILIGRETKIPDALILVTTLGGIDAFGFNGLLIGPVAAALFLTVWNRFSLRRHAAPASPPAR